LKNGKAAGTDEIQVELLKGGGETIEQRLTMLCNKVWDTGEVPTEWKDGIILPPPKKGNLADCNNWRGITLLSVPGKVLATVILNRLKAALEKDLRAEQAGFRQGRSCCDQIFTLRQIIEKVSATDNISLLVNFIDFKKAFDSIHRPSVWRILKLYGIPERIITIIQSFGKGCRCAVRVDGRLGDWFDIITGVRQGCVLSPLIFLIVMDWILKKATAGHTTGLQWLSQTHLCDLDFADDVALLDHTWSGMRDLTEKVKDQAASLGLKINTSKTKIISIGKCIGNESLEIDGERVEKVEEFCYLGSFLSNNSSCDKEIKVRLGKAHSTFGRLFNIWSKKSSSVKKSSGSTKAWSSRPCSTDRKPGQSQWQI